MPQESKTRTLKQNRALHLYYTWIAEALNEAGYDMKKVLKPKIEIPWTKESVKNHLWRPVQKIQLNKQSTTELETKEIDEIIDTLNRFMGEKLQIEYIPFPDYQALENALKQKEK